MSQDRIRRQRCRGRGRASFFKTRCVYPALLVAALLAFAVGGCGSSSSSTSTAAASTAPKAAKPSPAQVRAETAADRRLAGRAASFVAPETDNSVPTFGSEAGASARGQAETALTAYLRARSKSDWSSACNYLSASTRTGLEKLASSSKAKLKGCAAILGALSKGADLSDPLTGKVLSLRVQGQNAFALFYGPGHQQYIVPMAHQGGAWRLTQTAPIAYPPAAQTTTP